VRWLDYLQAAGYDAVVAFCAPQPGNLYRRLLSEHHWPNLVVRDIPKPSESP
jgi:hypothetical protein